MKFIPELTETYTSLIACVCALYTFASFKNFGLLVVLGLTVLSDSISVYIAPSPRERE